MPKRSVAYQQRLAKLGDRKAPLPLAEAIAKLKEMAAVKSDRAYAKGARARKGFDQSVELVMHLGIDPRQADQMVRGSISLPKGIGRTKRVLVFCPDEMVEAARAAGAVEAGSDELIKKVGDGWMDFDVAVAHPSVMGKVGKLGRVLGPQGKMPSPKSGTVTPDVSKAVTEYAAGKIEYRNDKGGNIHAVVGKASFADADLQANVEAFVEHIRRTKPAGVRGQFIRRVCLSGTMTPSVTVEVG